MELPDVIPTFDAFWSAYPRKQGDKAGTKRKFEKLSDADKYNCLQGTIYQTDNNPQWKNPTLIPLPSTFVNQKRWQDEVAQDKDAKARVIESAGDGPAHTVWAAMVGMYGQQWINLRGEEPDQFWSKFLKNIPEKRIKRALRTTLMNNTKFPPTLNEFMKYCAKTFEEQYPPALPKPAGDNKLALSALAEAKRILGVGDENE